MTNKSTIGRTGLAWVGLAVLFLVLVLFSMPSYTEAPQVLEVTGTPWAYLPFIVSEPTPTPTHTPTPSISDIKIITVDYNPPGFDILGEKIVFHNFGAAQPMAGWTLQAVVKGQTYGFKSSFVFASNADVTLWVKVGNDSPTDIYWNLGTPILQDSDTVILRDHTGKVIDSKSW